MDEIIFSDFAASGYNYVPVIRQLPLTYTQSDLLRCFPESSVWQLASHHRSYVYLALDYQHVVTACGNTVIAQQDKTVHTWPDTPLWPFIEDLHAGLTTPPLHTLYVDLPPLMGGMIGILPRMPHHPTITGWPDATWLVMKTLLIMDMHEKTLWLLAYDDPIHRDAWTHLNEKLDALTHRLANIPPETALLREHVRKAKAHLIQRQPESLITVATELEKTVNDTYTAMGYASTVTSEPAFKPQAADFLAYHDYGAVAYWLQQPSYHLLGASDKVHITLTGRELVALLASPVSSPDDALASVLWDSLRNDISKIALPGSMRIVDHTPTDNKHHWHTQQLQAQIAEDVSAFDVLQACYPSSAYLGVPKADALTQAHDASSTLPHPLGCHIAMIGWDHQSFIWVSQITKLWHATSEIHTDTGVSYEEIGVPVLAGLTPKLSEDKA